MQEPPYLLPSASQPARPNFSPYWKGLWKGLILTVTIAAMLGVSWRTSVVAPAETGAGIAFSSQYLLRAGWTLHELAHVIAVGVPGGDVSNDAAVLVKLDRVAPLIPAALAKGYYFRVKGNGGSALEDRPRKDLRNPPIPWFVFGFLAMSIANTLGLPPEAFVQAMTGFSVFLLSAAMAGLRLSIKLGDFRFYIPSSVCRSCFISRYR